MLKALVRASASLAFRFFYRLLTSEQNQELAIVSPDRCSYFTVVLGQKDLGSLSPELIVSLIAPSIFRRCSSS